MHRLVFTEQAQADLLEAWLFIAEDNPAATDKVLDTLEQKAKLLFLQPLMGRARPEFGGTVRSWPSATPAPHALAVHGSIQGKNYLFDKMNPSVPIKTDGQEN
jgi:plasmid stabilization system protein ParE